MNEQWSEFARDNQGESVLPERILGKDLLDSVSDPTVRQIYEAIIKRVRAGAVVRFSYRCDAPANRRVFDMKVHLLDESGAEFVSTLIHEEARTSVPFLEAGRVRNQSLLRVCSWCQMVAIPGGGWLPVEEAVARLQLLETVHFPGITHGICPACHAEMMAKLDLL